MNATANAEVNADNFGGYHLATAILSLPNATDEERQTLLEILDLEGFGGAEYATEDDPPAASALAADRLGWLRHERIWQAADAAYTAWAEARAAVSAHNRTVCTAR